ncbi:hypothetical protein LINGRAHAP2_LOCUS15331, partial [Linum grandiflorum]
IPKKVGSPIRIDHKTSLVSRGKFVQICVELNLSKPLPPKVGIDGVWLPIEYEGVISICRSCCFAGHTR